MKIRFETTIDDNVAFSRFHFAKSGGVRKLQWYLTLPVVVLGICGVLVMMLNNLDLWPVAGILTFGVSIAWHTVIGWVFPWLNDLGVRTQLAEGSNLTLLGWREMEIVNGHLILITELSYSSLDLRAIEKILGDKEYTYVYIGSVFAYVIPMNRYPDGDCRAFVEELMEAWENRDAPRLVDSTPASDERIMERPH